MREERSVEITTGTVIKILLVLLLLWFLFLIKDVIMIVFVAFVVSSAIRPWVDRLQKYRIPRVVSVISIAVIFFGLVSVALVTLVPALITDIRLLAAKLPELYSSVANKIFSFGDAGQTSALTTLQNNLQSFTQGLLQLTSGVFGTLSTIFGGVAAFLTVLVISFFMTMEENGTKKLIQSLAPEKYQPYLNQLIGKIEHKMGSWLRGQLLLCIIIAAASFIGLTILGVKFALVLALLAGFFEIVPFIGPVLGAIPAVFFAATESPLLALLVVILYVIIQQLENNIIVPKVMQQTVGLHPIIILLALLIGGRLGGVVGIIMAVPLVAIFAIFFRDLFEERRNRMQRDVST